MPAIQITADFPGIRSEELHELYRRMENSEWKKMHDHHGHLDTTWHAYFPEHLTEKEAINHAHQSFMALCSPYQHPVLVLQCIHSHPEYSA